MAAPKFHTLAGLPIPRGMVWSDEFAWMSYEKASERSLTGSLIIDGAEKIKGRPITLAAQADAGWITRAALEALYALHDGNPLATLTLTLADGRSFSVQFAPDGVPITAEPRFRPELPAPEQPHVATVRLITV
jgi:hypothetical protein